MPPITTLEDRISSLTARLEIVETRLSLLEARAPAPNPPPAVPDIDFRAGEDVLPVSLRVDGRRITTALGRSLIVLGGAFLLRALTDAGAWPPAAGATRRPHGAASSRRTTPTRPAR